MWKVGLNSSERRRKQNPRTLLKSTWEQPRQNISGYYIVKEYIYEFIYEPACIYQLESSYVNVGTIAEICNTLLQ